MILEKYNDLDVKKNVDHAFVLKAINLNTIKRKEEPN